MRIYFNQHYSSRPYVDFGTEACFGTVSCGREELLSIMMLHGGIVDETNGLCVSDFGWSSVSPEVMELIRINKAKGMKFYGLNIDKEGLKTFMVSEIIDSMWIWVGKKNLCYEDKGWK